jgi:Family of unknown function (DUF5335)
MTIRKLDKTNWRAFFDRLSKLPEGKQAEIEVASLALGDQVEAEWLPLLGITYDPKDDLVEVALDGVDHMIPKPREIHVDEGFEGLVAVEIVDAQGTKQIIKLRDPLMLAAPAKRPG